MTTVESVHQDRQLHGSSVSDGSEHHEWRTFVDHSSELSGIHTEPSLDKMQATREARTMSTSGGFEPTKPSSFAWGENNFPSERPYETSGGFDNMGDLRDTRNSLHSADGISRTRKDLLAAGSPVGGFRATNSANELRRMSLMGRGFDSARHGTPARAPSRSLLEESPGGGHGAATFSHGPRDIRFDYVFENQTNEQPKKGFEFEKGEIGFSGAKQMDSRALSFDDENTLDWGNQSTPPTPASFVSLDTTAHHTAWESGRTEIRAPAASVDSTELSGWAVAVDEESVIAETEANGLREWSRATDNFSRAGSTRSLATRDNGVACDSPWRGSVTGRSSVVPEPSLDDVQEWPRAPFDTPMSSSAWGDSSVEGWPGTTVARSLDFSNAEDMSTTNGGTHRHRRHHHHSKHHKKASPPPMANLESDDRALASSAVEAWKPPQPGAAQRSPYKRSLSAQCSQHLKKVSTSLAGQWDAFKIGVLGRRSSRVADESLRRSFDSELENYLYLMEMTEHIPSVREMVIEPWAKYFALRMQQGSEAAEEEEEVGEGEDSLGALLTEEPRPVRTERRIFVSILSFPAGLPRPDSLEMRLYTSDRSEILAMAYAARGEPLSLEVPQDIPPNPLIELIFGGCELVARYEWAAAICCPGAPLEAGLEERGRRKDEFGVGEEPKSILASFKIAYVTKESFRQSVSSLM
ncbi:chromosome X 22 [Perkinsus chesapeaki]|uniref:Chromosome X 22 n=1 Tax=Perkinsus chesapeaki TaxID=330153 RepID=A0A7J6LKH3_PERCH|nr:chromosome X 22 [Perkinsus chesapeaki]